MGRLSSADQRHERMLAMGLILGEYRTLGVAQHAVESYLRWRGA